MQIVNITDLSKPKKVFDSNHKYVNRGYLDILKSVKENGIMIPLCVKKVGKRYQILDGLQRYYAALECNITQIPIQLIKTD